MKKLTITTLAFMFAAGIVLAQPMPNKEERKKEFQEMNTLVENYKKEKNKKKKAAIEAQVKTKVSANYDRHIKFMEKMVIESENRLNKAKEKLANSLQPEAKVKHIDEVAKKILSGEKPTLFGPPDRDKKFNKKHKMDKHNQGKICDRPCPCMKDGDRPFDKDGMILPPPLDMEDDEGKPEQGKGSL